MLSSFAQQKSVSTIAPPAASDSFKTDSGLFLPPFFFAGLACSCRFYCKCKSSSHLFLIRPPVTINVPHCFVDAIDDLGGGYRRNIQESTTI